MKYRPLGKSSIEVSTLCLGTMTWGRQNDERQAHAQLDHALGCGINFIDTAEMYPIPPERDTYSLTERYIGSWDKMRSRRSDLVIATKIAGPGLPYIRGGSRFTKDHIRRAVESSLSRLRTDFIDLYQLHWPERATNRFGVLGFQSDPGESFTAFEDILETFDGLRKEGKVREFGISNETPWGAMSFLEKSRSGGYPGIVSIQNPYNLLNRTYEIGMAEVSIRERCGLLAYSPLAFGVLTGKYMGGPKPKGARLSIWPHYDRYSGSKAKEATEKYVRLALAQGLSPAKMALAFVTSRPFVTSTIIGATDLAQLGENIGSAEVVLGGDIEKAIEGIHCGIPNPAP